jgi:pimeloyl-ACP methyl ester carboxylesterase
LKKKTKYISFKEGKIAYTIQGRGRAIVLLHGFLGSTEIWEGVAQALSKSFRVVCIDLPGHGQSDCFGYIHSMELMAQAVKTVMDKLRFKSYVLIGHSMGGYVSLAFAELFPESIRGLCLLHSTSYPDSEQKKRERDKAIKAVKNNYSIYVRATIKNLFATKNLKSCKKDLQHTQQIAKKTSKQGVVAALEGMKTRASRDMILHFAEYPVLFIIGKYDNVIPMQTMLDQAELPKRKSVLLLENSGHMGFIEQSELCIKQLRGFARGAFKPLN